MDKGIYRPGGDISGTKGGNRRPGSPGGGSGKTRPDVLWVRNIREDQVVFSVLSWVQVSDLNILTRFAWRKTLQYLPQSHCNIPP